MFSSAMLPSAQGCSLLATSMNASFGFLIYPTTGLLAMTIVLSLVCGLLVFSIKRLAVIRATTIDQKELQAEHEMAAERFQTEIMDLKSELYALQQIRPPLQNRLQMKGMRARVYERNAKWQEKDEAGKARREALKCKTAKAATTARSFKTTTIVATATTTAPNRPAFVPRLTARVIPENNIASGLFDHLKDPRYLAHRANCKLRWSEARAHRCC